MTAYIIVEVEVQDPVTYEGYKKLTPASLIPFNGKFIVRGGEVETLEGDWPAKRIVVLEFPSKELARQWWASEEYAPAKKIRQQTATTKMILIQGAE
jgi:uncharacterized protein (DUF1330 family)